MVTYYLNMKNGKFYRAYGNKVEVQSTTNWVLTKRFRAADVAHYPFLQVTKDYVTRRV